MKQILNFLAVVILAIFLAGCSDFGKTSYATLATLGESYNAVMLSASDAHKSGIINDVQKQKIIDAGNVFYGSYQTATKALEIYIKAEQGGYATTKTLVAQTIATAITDFNVFIANYNAVADGVKGMRKWDEYKEVK